MFMYVCKLHTCVSMCMHMLYMCVCMTQIIVVENFCNFSKYMIIIKIIFTKFIYIMLPILVI